MNGKMREIREIIRDEMFMQGKILKVLKGGPMTVPEIAAAVGYPSCEVMYWVMGMRKYGHVAETQEVTEEGYHKYAVVERGRS
ncbi:MAG: MarR family transcriptional regulator [Firmicutes bacterium]|nr:MarR family transcriptional regulator [Bacillota bacterium]